MKARLLLLCALLVAALGVRALLAAGPAVPLRKPLEEFPRSLGRWEEVERRSIKGGVLQVLQTNDHLWRTYRSSEGDTVDLFIAYYDNQRTGETMHSPRNCLPGTGWKAVEDDTRSIIPQPGAPPVQINRYLVEKEGRHALVYYWYQAHGRVIASEYWGKLYLVWDSLRYRRRDGALVRVVVPLKSSQPDAEAKGLDFIQLVFPHLPDFLPS